MQENPEQIISAKCDNAVTPSRFVKYTSTGVDVATAGTDKIAGVYYGKVTSTAGQTIAVVRLGTVIVEASAAISKGAYVTATTGGKAVSTTTSGDTVAGIARQAAANSGDLIEVALTYFKY